MKTNLIPILIVIVVFLMSCNKESIDESLTPSIEKGQLSSSYIEFKDEAQLLDILQEIKNKSLEGRKSIAIIRDLYSMLDAYEEICNLKDEGEYKKFIEKNNQFLQITKIANDSGDVQQIVCPKINLIFASVVNTEGKLKVGNVIYNLLDKENSSQLTESLIKYLTGTDTSPLKSYVSIPDYLPILIPMTASFYFPVIYPTKYFRTTISGRNVIVQLWKGYCPGIWGYAGGVGAEVGLYYPVSWSSSLWFPDYKHPKNISYSLYIKSTNKYLFSASLYTWWLNKWEKNYYGLPMSGSSYKLKYTINGVTRYW